MAAPCLTSQAALNKSTSSILTTPSHTHTPGLTSSAFDCCDTFGDTAPPLVGSMTTFSEETPFTTGFGLPVRETEEVVSSGEISRALLDVE